MIPTVQQYYERTILPVSGKFNFQVTGVLSMNGIVSTWIDVQWFTKVFECLSPNFSTSVLFALYETYWNFDSTATKRNYLETSESTETTGIGLKMYFTFSE